MSESALWCAVIETAFYDATDKVTVSRPLGKMYVEDGRRKRKWTPRQVRKLQALSFFKTARDQFEWICHNLNIDPEGIRERISSINSQKEVA